jgi:hypothetical protein
VVNKTDILNQEIAAESETKCCECWENYEQTTKQDDWLINIVYNVYIHTYTSSQNTIIQFDCLYMYVYTHYTLY